MKKRYPPDKTFTLTCQGANCGKGEVANFTITLEQTQASVPSPYAGREAKPDRWTVMYLKCVKCGFIVTVGTGLGKGCGWEERLEKEGKLLNLKERLRLD
jgi:hypothetical protein